MLAFLHLPKTGGTSIRSMIHDAGIAYWEINSPDAAANFLLTPHYERQRLRVVFGHMAYGVHRYEPRARYATFLRDPIERLVSSYLHILRVPEHPWHADARSGRLSFGRYATTERNSQTLRLSRFLFADPVWWERWGGDQIHPAQLAEAKRTLESCAFIGLFETFAKDVETLGRMFELPFPASLYHENANTASLTLSKKERSKAEAENALDFELYEYARTLRVP